MYICGRSRKGLQHVKESATGLEYLIASPALFADECMSQQLGNEVQRQGKANKSTMYMP